MKPNLKRLERLAEHLESGKLAHSVFDIDQLDGGLIPGHPEDKDIQEGNVCGTAGCAVGELPAVWPKVFKWKRHADGVSGTVLCRENPYISGLMTAGVWFNLPEAAVYSLFSTYRSVVVSAMSEIKDPKVMRIILDLPSLNNKATRRDVAASIRQLVKAWREADLPESTEGDNRLYLPEQPVTAQ